MKKTLKYAGCVGIKEKKAVNETDKEIHVFEEKTAAILYKRSKCEYVNVVCTRVSRRIDR